MSSRRKSEAATHVGDDPAPHHHEESEEKKKLKKIPNIQSSKVGRGFERRMGRGVRILQMFSQKRAFQDWIAEIDCLFSKFDSCALSDSSGGMVYCFGSLQKQRVKKQGGLIGRG